MSKGARPLSEQNMTTSTVGGLAAADARPGADGIPVLLVPGYTGSKEDFGPLLPLLAPHRAVAVDQPGQFESPRLPSYTFEALGEAVLTVIDALGGKAHVVGHSFGGLVCRHAALVDPSRFVSLTLMDSGPGALGGKRATDTAMLLPLLLMMTPHDVFNGLVAGGFGVDEPLLRARWEGTDPQQLVDAGHLLMSAPDRTEELASSGVDVSVLFGADDNAWVPAVQTDMARRLGRAPVVIGGAVHSPAVENPVPTAAALLAIFASAEARVLA